jgi:hypothetical protein
MKEGRELRAQEKKREGKCDLFKQTKLCSISNDINEISCSAPSVSYFFPEFCSAGIMHSNKRLFTHPKPAIYMYFYTTQENRSLRENASQLQ